MAAIVEGSTIRSGDRVRINVQLIDGRTDKHLWADKFDREYRDILALQSEAALAIARQIQATLTPAEVGAATRTRPVNPEAHELYIKGRFYWNLHYLTGEGLKFCRDYLGQALEKDPDYAPAYAALATCLWESAVQGHVPPHEAFPQVKALLKTALELDNTLAEALAATAATKFYYDWDWAGAELEYRRAIAANPNYANGHRIYGFYLLWMGRLPEARAEFARALELDPLSTTMNYSLGYGLAYSGRFDEAIQQLHRTLQLDSNYAFGHSVLAAFYLKQSKTEEAIQAAERAISLSGRSPNLLRALAQTYAAAGRIAETEKILKELEQLWKQKRARATDLASVCGLLGKKDQAFQWLEEAYRERDSALVMLKMQFAFDSLRPDPRFQALLRRLNFPP